MTICTVVIIKPCRVESKSFVAQLVNNGPMLSNDAWDTGAGTMKLILTVSSHKRWHGRERREMRERESFFYFFVFFFFGARGTRERSKHKKKTETSSCDDAPYKNRSKDRK
jgi:hypothetical protein